MSSSLSDAIDPVDVDKYALNCTKCGKYKLDHKYDLDKCREWQWDYDLRKMIPNLILLEGKWYQFHSRALLIPLLVKPTVTLTVERQDSVSNPRPRLIETYGDIYNFCAQYNVLDKLKLIVTPEVFKSMQSKSIERALKKLSK